jgi:hypothetical protein
MIKEMIGRIKKAFFLILMFPIFVLCSGCDMHSGKRPYNYPPAKWVSEKPEMWFGGVYWKYGFDGCLILDGQNIEIEVFFNKGDGVAFGEKGKLGTRGRCKFRPDKLVVEIDKERDIYFKGEYKTITFIRMP